MFTATSLDGRSNERLIVSLSGSGAHSCRVRSLEIVSGDMTNRYCFSTSRPLEHVFAPEFASSFLAALGRENLQDGEIDVPMFSVILPGVGVSGLRIEPVHEGEDSGTLKLHFSRYVGDIMRVLRPLSLVEITPATVRERIAVEVLGDIVSPIFDIISLSQPGFTDVLKNNSEAIEQRLARLAAQQEEIEFYTGLLKRYVAGCMQDSAEKSDTTDDGLWPSKRYGHKF